MPSLCTPVLARALSAWLVFFASWASAAEPTASTSAATQITISSALLNGVGSPQGEETTGWFRLSTTDPGDCDDVFGTRVPATDGTDLGTGTVNVPYSITATGLVAGTTYHFCAIVSNASGTAFGDVLTFTVPAPPLVDTTAPDPLGSTTATLKGSANPVGSSTSGWFRYDDEDPGACTDSFGTRAPSSGGTSLGAGSTEVAYTRSISNLLPGKTYWACAIASNAYGTTFGDVVEFTTDAVAPTVSTYSTTTITSTTATFRGNANPGGASTSVWFRYATTSPGTCNDTFGTRAPTTGGEDIGSGNSGVSFTRDVTALAPSTTYYACAIAENTEGKAYGSVVTFTTAAPPIATTSYASSVTDSSARLYGSAVPNRASTQGWFRYAATHPGTCNDTFGSRAPTTGGSNLGSGDTAQSYYQNISNLSSGVTYYFCAIAENSEGKAYGDVLEFTTVSEPTATTEPVTAITASSATFHGTGDPNGASTTAWFRWSTSDPGVCSDSFGSRWPTYNGDNLGAGTASVDYSRGITSLQPGTTYYVCAIVQNSYGTAWGEVVSFTTDADIPTVSTSTPIDLTGSTATLRGSATPKGAEATGWFRYDTVSPGTCNDTFGTRAPASGGADLGSGNSSVAFTQAITGLTPGQTYYACAIAENAEGKDWGTVRSFTTPLPPTVSTTDAYSITNVSATLRGEANPNLSTATGWFRYGTTEIEDCTDAYGSRAPASGGSNLGSGSSSTSFTRSVSGLSVGTTYYFCAVAENSEGVVVGNVQTFTTLAPPTVSTEAASSISSTSAVLHGAGDPNGASTRGWFRYSTTDPGTCTDSFGTRQPSSSGTSLGSGTDDVDFSRTSGTLQPGTQYYYCAIVSNSYGYAYGDIETFTTPAAEPRVTTSSATAVTGTTATIRGSADPRGAATTAWFRYATTSPGTCNDTFGTRAPTTGGFDAGSGNGYLAYTQAISSLAPSTTYYVCAIAENAEGKVYGSLVSFTTASLPDAETYSPTYLYNTSARLNGAGTPNGSTSTGWFRYSTTKPTACNDTFGSATTTSNLGSGSSANSYYANVSGLSEGQTYHYCAVVESDEGKAYGELVTFTTPAAPTAATEAASSITASTALLNGSGDPNGNSARGWFRYSTTDPGDCSDSFGTRLPSSSGTSLGSGTDDVHFARSASSLLPGTTYYVCAIVNNSYGTSWGDVVSFTTEPDEPTVGTYSTINLAGTGATLRGYANPKGAATTAWFRYATVSPGSCNDTFGTRAPTTGGFDAGSGTSNQSYTQAITGLTPGETYYACAIAENSEGKVFGSVVTFTTPLPPEVETVGIQSLSNTSATLRGEGTPNGSSTSGWFRYATSEPEDCDDTFGSRAPTTGGSNLGSGTSAVSFTQSISGLSQGATYWFCALAQSDEGLVTGEVQSFTTADAPLVTTEPTDPVGATTATLRGTGTPSGATTRGWFRYSTTDPGTCSDSFGSRTPSSSGTNLGAGSTPVDFARSISSLSPGQTYYACAIVSNSYGYAYGELVEFTTDPSPPTATTYSPATITGTTASLRGGSNPGGADTTVWFRYDTVSPGSCNDSFGTRAPTTGGEDAGDGISTVSIDVDVTGLTPGQTYYVCAIAENSEGKAYGTVRTFETALPPEAETTFVNNLTNTAARLYGEGTPNLSATTGWFRYSPTEPDACNDTFGSRAPTTGGTNLGSGSSAQSYYANISGLSEGTTYYYCAIVESAEGKAYGEVSTFQTLSHPEVSTSATTAVSSTGATLNGSADPNGATTYGWFRYSTTDPGVCSDSFGTRIPSSSGTNLGASSEVRSYARSISNLTPGTTYYVCALASNSYGTSVGEVLSFTTPPDTPSVSTYSATAITSSSATWRGAANPGGAATQAWFRYDTVSPGSCNDTFGTRSPTSGGTNVGAGNSSVQFTQQVTGLTPGQRYYVCAIAENSVGKEWGSVVAVDIPRPPEVITLAATPVTAESATLNAAGSPNGYSTTGWFRYSTTDPGTCSDGFGTRAPTTGGTSLGGGSNAVPYNRSISGLSPGTTYYFCALVSSSVDQAVGEVLSFTTPAAAPSVTTLATTAIGPTTATAQASANPNGSAATGWFRYATTATGLCNDGLGAGTRVPASGGYDLGEGTGAVPFSGPLTGLSLGQQYHVCAFVSNSVGQATGTVTSFTTSATPTVVSREVVSISSAGATAQATVNPNGTTATAWFRYGTTDPGTCSDSYGTRAPASGGTALGSGSTGVDVTRALTGLAGGTTYWVCPIASNSIGTSVGAPVQFTTPAAPLVSTSPVTGLTATTVSLQGSGTPRGASTTGWFRYSTTHPGTCDDAFGTRAPAASGASLGSGQEAVPFTQPLSGLQAGTTYHACAIAQNAEGTAFGAVVSFTTPNLPAITTLAATDVTIGGATLQGSVTPRGDDTSGWFRYSDADPGACNDTFGTRTGDSLLGSGSTAVPLTQPISGLDADTTWWFCAIAENSAGKAYGEVRTFTTSAGPTVRTLAPTGIASTTATLRGAANPKSASATGWFRWDTTDPGACNDTFGTRAPAAGGSVLGSGSVEVSFDEAATGLPSGTTVYACAVAENASGKGFGEVVSFTTPAPPTVTTDAVADITGTTATLHAQGTPNGRTATGWFRYGTTDPGDCDDTFGTRVPTTGGTDLGAGSDAVAYTQALTGLEPGTTYTVCAIVQTTEGTALGATRSFTTPAPPAVTTQSPTGVGLTAATLMAQVNPSGQATTAWFRYGTSDPGTCTDGFGTATSAQAIGSGGSLQSVTATVTGLAPATVWYACAVAENDSGRTFGGVVSFVTTDVPAVATLAPTGLGTTAATLQGTADPRGADTTGWFRWSTSDPGACDDSFGTRVPSSGGFVLGDGSTPVAFQQGITGLSPRTTVWFCALAENGSGVATGPVVSFTTPDTPLVTTEPITELGPTSVTLHAEGTPRGAQATGWFRYDTSHPGSCTDSFGIRVPAAGGTDLGSGDDAVAFSESLDALTPGTTYHACALVQSAEGLVGGAVVSFTTPRAPAVATLAPTGLGPGSVTLQAEATPNGASTVGWFRYGTTDPGDCSEAFGTATAETPLGAGSTAMPFSQALTGLNPATTFYACALARNSAGTVLGELVSFTTPATPTIATLAATDLTATSATLQASAQPNGDDTTGWFRWSATDPGACDDTFGTRVPAAGGVALGAGTTDVPFSQSVTGLAPGATVWFCALAENGQGITTGTVLSFTTPAPPAVDGLDATGVGRTEATLEGVVNPRGSSTTAWFRYGTSDPGVCNDAFGTRAPTAGLPLGAGQTDQTVRTTVSSLMGGTTYWFCAVAENAHGVTTGPVHTFTTPDAPAVFTDAPADVTANDLTLRGTGNPNGSTTSAWFRIGTTDPGACSDSFGTRVPASGTIDLGDGDALVGFEEDVTGLEPGTTYWFCAIASNAVDTAFGEVRTATTPSVPDVTTGAPSSVTRTSATFQAMANPNGRSSTGWFRYDTTDPGDCDDAFGTRVPASGGVALGSGSAAVPYFQSVTGLTGETTYYVCAFAESATGIGHGEVVRFDTNTAPGVVTDDAYATSQSTATLEGSADPRGESTMGWFRYDTVDPGDCDDSFGTRVPSTGGTPLGAGTAFEPYTEDLTGLAPGTTYYACAIADSAGGTGLGQVLAFTTPDAPDVVTLAAEDVEAGSVTLRGTVDPNGGDAGAWFRWSALAPVDCDDSFGTRAPVGAEISVGSGDNPVAIQEGLSGLSPATTYTYCAIATNLAGTTFGELRTVTTSAAAPTVTTDPASEVGAGAATLHGTATPNGAATGAWFRYGTTDPGDCDDTYGTRVPASGSFALGDGIGPATFSEPITGLTNGVPHYACAFAINAYGLAVGEVVTFTPDATAPTVFTDDAFDITATAATLAGEATPHGSATTGWFRYGDADPVTCDGAFGTRLPATGGVSLGSGAVAVAFEDDATALLPAATYWFCAAADNAGGVTYGSVASFSTDAAPPEVTTRTPDATADLVTLRGGANPQGTASEGWFRVDATDPGGCDDTFGQRVPATGTTALGDGRTEAAFSEDLPLAAGTWFVCALAENAAGVGTGEVVTFVVPEAGDTDDTGTTDTSEDTDEPDTGTDSGLGDTDDTDGDPKVTPSCQGCAAGGAPPWSGVLLLVTLAWVRRRPSARA